MPAAPPSPGLVSNPRAEPSATPSAGKRRDERGDPRAFTLISFARAARHVEQRPSRASRQTKPRLCSPRRRALTHTHSHTHTLCGGGGTRVHSCTLWRRHSHPPALTHTLCTWGCSRGGVGVLQGLCAHTEAAFTHRAGVCHTLSQNDTRVQCALTLCQSHSQSHTHTHPFTLCHTLTHTLWRRRRQTPLWPSGKPPVFSTHTPRVEQSHPLTLTHPIRGRVERDLSQITLTPPPAACPSAPTGFPHTPGGGGVCCKARGLHTHSRSAQHPVVGHVSSAYGPSWRTLKAKRSLTRSRPPTLTHTLHTLTPSWRHSLTHTLTRALTL
jgi:hypothetical protein